MQRISATFSQSSPYVNAVTAPEMKYPIILQYMRIVEANERLLIKRLSQNRNQRMTVDELATTIRKEYWSNYNKMDVRRGAFRWFYRLSAYASRTLPMLQDSIAANRLKRLEAAIRTEFKRPPDPTS